MNLELSFFSQFNSVTKISWNYKIDECEFLAHPLLLLSNIAPKAKPIILPLLYLNLKLVWLDLFSM